MSERRRRQKNRQVSETNMTRRDVIRTVVVITGVLGLGGAAGAAYLVNRASNGVQDKTQHLSLLQDKEVRVEELIEQLDRSLAGLKEKIANNTVYSAEITQRLLAPLELYERNKANPNRNKAAQRRQDFEAGRESASQNITLNITDPDAFAIDITEQPDPSIVAEYKASDSTLVLRPDFEPGSNLSVLVAYHELVHAYQDQQLKQSVVDGDSIAMRIYVNRRAKSAGSDKRAIILDEAEAYIMQTYSFNILSQGQLQQDAASGSISGDKYQESLHVSQHDRYKLDFFLQIADSMFDSSTTLDYTAPEFTQFMVEHHRQQGRVPYDIDSAGNLQPMP
ncbi:hypothetical protein A3C23_00640 [Candidatus Roizmanbacteria bacterium RIFCSPHIGHO2_02_FULL_37_13b]|uniref:Uncharacterized protein n=1 Tax=Candidatus Roizmanbacteria bacterium RIFCSPLOWO2_02_FULL_36_11 TaxID=1802071 RepID=A0A1F7JD20_9BACT|nr:MAG: hypothetical protein A3C23_00640 [Candidatus Roizmanbacteria bacterium RIFCSPHIGHO2_02_FULL_37_13b]OGK53505.1 MAG: hypothetical protein A3H78_04750 [Candidatus Roizmanbacteria bacterium RIFCSPLOWO2_02_FULL_36_11]